MQHGIKPAIKKTMVTSTAHRLMNHPGACRRLHGHNYVITIHLGSREFSEINGMVADFGTVKKVIGVLIDGLFDHTCVLQEGDPLIDILRGENLSVLVMKVPPTAENMALYLMDIIPSFMDDAGWKGIYVCKIEVEETPNNVGYAIRRP